MNLKLLTFKILTWAQLEHNLSLVESCHGTYSLNPGREYKEKPLAHRPAWPSDVRTWGLSPYIKLGLLKVITLRHCRPYRGYYHWASSPGPLCREWGVSSSRVGWTGRDQAARNTGHTSHIDTMTCSQKKHTPKEHQTWNGIPTPHLPLCLYLLFKN